VAVLTENCSPEQLIGLAQAAEESGLHHFCVADHRTRLDPRSTSPPLEAFCALTLIACATSSIELGSLVAALPARSGHLLAQSAWTLATLAPGRFALGVGYGWHDPDLQTSCGDPEASAATAFATLATESEVPIPVVVGGTSQRALALASRHADRWYGYGPTLRLERCVSRLEALAAAEERRRPAVGLLATSRADLKDLAKYQQLDVEYFTLLVTSARQLRQFGRVTARLNLL
jgi:alkanesulfonate monooxygenase SsuD/methylene tetrahydromethanopterin reductase-like flavin-dependent oxidoreductase (luciferase family)